MQKWVLMMIGALALGLAGCGQGDQGADENAADSVDQVEQELSDLDDGGEMADDMMDDMAEETMAEPELPLSEDPAADVVDFSFQQAQSALLASYAELPATVTTDSGLMYQVQREGDGASPGPRDTVEVHYEGRLVDGSIFDSSYERGETIEFPLDRVIPGWTEGLQYMQVGAQHQLVLPSDLAYGERSPGPGIPPNAVLIFQVELFNVTPVAED